MRRLPYLLIIIMAVVVTGLLSGARWFGTPVAIPAPAPSATAIIQSTPTAPVPADIVLNANGCAEGSNFTLPATHEPTLLVRNDAAEAMVFTVPQLQRSVSVPPGQVLPINLPRYIMGSFASYCLTDRQHTALGGTNPYLCILQPAEIAPYALTVGTFTIAPHDRIKELNNPPA